MFKAWVMGWGNPLPLRVVTEIAAARAKLPPDHQLIIGHGSGSFAHAPALRYQTMDGFTKKDSLMGMAITQDSAAQLNRIVVKEFLAQELPAVSFLFSNTLVTHQKKVQHWCGEVLWKYLQKGLWPVTGGDVIVDAQQGCTIWSTEKILNYLAKVSLEQGYQIDRIVHVTEVDGVLDKSGAVIPEVTSRNLGEIRQQINGVKGFDVTGGMWHKIEESLDLAKQGITSAIVSGMKPNLLYNSLAHHQIQGTIIHA